MPAYSSSRVSCCPESNDFVHLQSSLDIREKSGPYSPSDKFLLPSLRFPAGHPGLGGKIMPDSKVLKWFHVHFPSPQPSAGKLIKGSPNSQICRALLRLWRISSHCLLTLVDHSCRSIFRPGKTPLFITVTPDIAIDNSGSKSRLVIAFENIDFATSISRYPLTVLCRYWTVGRQLISRMSVSKS
jgi:hypothetical protein